MGPRSKRKYLEAIFLRYKKSSHTQKSLILDECCATTGYHSKYVIWLLRHFKRFTKPAPKKRGPKPVYQTEALLKPLKRIWRAANLPTLKDSKSFYPYGSQAISNALETFPTKSRKVKIYISRHH